MVQAALDAPPVRSPDHYVRRILTSRAIPKLRELAHDLVEGGIDEVQELDLGDRLEPVKRHSDRGPNDPGLGERSIDDPVRPELLEESVRRAEHAPVHAHVLAEDEDVRVLAHRVVKSSIDGLNKVQLGHGLTTPSRTSAS